MTLFEMPGRDIGRRLNWTYLAFCAIAVFGFCVINYWIYAARFQFLQNWAHTYPRPPTISRAISIREIGDPFAIWVTTATAGMALAVGALAVRYISVVRAMSNPPFWLRSVGYIMAPACAVFQVASVWGVYIQGQHSVVYSTAMHMLGSSVFFVTQALVILLYAVINQALLMVPKGLAEADAVGLISARWVERRRTVAGLSVLATAVYGALFALKNVFPYDGALPWVHVVYVNFEPMVITTFLLTVVLAFADKIIIRPPQDLSN